MSNYPPGVTGNEYEIAGPDFEEETDEKCPNCGGDLFIQGYHLQKWVACDHCDFTEDRSEEWCCDAGFIGHSGRHWLEGGDE